jgi:hypothetical protein
MQKNKYKAMNRATISVQPRMKTPKTYLNQSTVNSLDGEGEECARKIGWTSCLPLPISSEKNIILVEHIKIDGFRTSNGNK